MIQRHPLTTGLSALIVLGLLAVPLFSMRLAFTDAGNDPLSLTTRQAYDLLAQGFGPGFNGPLVLAAEVPAGRRRGRRRHGGARSTGGCGSTPGVAYATRAALQRRPVHGGDHRLPDHRPPGGPDGRTW